MTKQWLVAFISFCLPSFADAQQGVWEDAFVFGDSTDPYLQPIVAVHLIHLHTGKVLAFTYAGDGQPADPNCTVTVNRNFLWTLPPSNGTPDPEDFEPMGNCDNFVFCTGHSAMADGRILVAGSEWANTNNAWTPFADLFDPNFLNSGTAVWNLPNQPPNMAKPRWYPTCTTLPDGKVLVTAGTHIVNGEIIPVTIPELYDPAASHAGTWTQLTTASMGQPYYPYMFVLPDGNLIDAGPGAWNFILNRATWTWAGFLEHPTWPQPAPHHPSYDASAVMYEPGKIMRCGGANPGEYGLATTWVVDLNGANINAPPPWMNADPMNRARLHHNLVILPDGKVLAVGGAFLYTNDVKIPCFDAEIFDPSSGTWALQSPSDQTQPRMYHSTAMLLPDGRVVSAGGNFTPTAQIFKPPYITSGAPRPTIVTAPTQMQYGQQYTIQYQANGGAEATKACLIRLAAVTHGFDQNQRRVSLTVTSGGTGGGPPEPSPPNPTLSIIVDAPANANLAPPGYYMLFILNEYAKNKFAPCTMAAYVKVEP